MKLVAAGITTVSIMAAGCARIEGPPLVAADAIVYAALPGQAAAVAYLTIHNNSTQDIVVTDAMSQDFADVQIHETDVSGGVARMRALHRFEIKAGSRVTLEPGGKHLMLLGPTKDIRPGDLVSIEFRYGEGGMLQLQLPVRERTAN